METTVKYGHLVTINGLSKANASGSLSALGFTDPNIYVQTLPVSILDETAKGVLNVRNYSNLVFQIWPKLNFEANKEYQKLKKNQKMLKQIGVSDDNSEMSDFAILMQRIEKMEKRKKDEIESNQALLESYMNMEVTYGSEIQLYHIDSKSFLNGKILCSDTDKSAYKFELSDQYGTGMIFKVFPRYKLRQEGEIVQYKDQVLFYNIKLKCYMNFSTERSIEIDTPMQFDAKNVKNLYKNFDLKHIDEGSLRYEAYLSNVTDCYWQVLFHAAPEPMNSYKLKGGDLIRIRHTEYLGDLAAETNFINDFEEVYLRRYIGEFSEELNSINSIWEVEIDRTNFRGDVIEVSNDDPQFEHNEEAFYRLRHLLSGKLLTIYEGFISGRKEKLLMPGLMKESDLKNNQPKGKGNVEFAPTTAENPEYCEDNSYYHLRIDHLYLYVDEKSLYKDEGPGANLAVTMTKIKKKPKDKLNMTGTMTNFSFANNEASLYTPLKDKEHGIERYGVLCKKEKSNENAFQIVKVDEHEKQDILFVNSVYGTLLRFINVIKAGKTELLRSELLKKVKKALALSIFFVVKTENIPDAASDLVSYAIECEGISQVTRQKIFKDMRLIELLTDILYWPFRIPDFCDIKRLSNVDPEILTIFQLSYRLIKHAIKEFRPNEIYASQWLDLFLKQTMLTNNENNIYADTTLIELIDNNRRILEAKIKSETIEDFIELLMNQELHEKYVKLLSALTTCDGQAMVTNQQEISKIIFDSDENKVVKTLIFPIEMKDYKLYIKVYDNEYIELNTLQSVSEKKDGGRIYQYFIEFTTLLANLCLNRNYLAIDRVEKIYSFDICYQIISNDYDLPLKTCFCKLILSLYIDRKPNIKLLLPNRIRIWTEMDANKNLLLTAKLDLAIKYDFEKIKGFVSQYLGQMKLLGCQKSQEKDANELTQAVLVLCKNMLEFGFYKSTDELDDLLNPLFSLLNGTKDVTSKDEQEEIQKQRLKGGASGSSSTLLQRKKNRKRRKQLSSSIVRKKTRYEESENNRIVHGCKGICCEILKFIMELRNDMRVSLFLCEFKRILENNPNEPVLKGKLHSSLRMSSPTKRKNYSKNISKSNMQKIENEEEELQNHNFLNIIDEICNGKSIDFTNSPFDPIAIYLDLLQYDNENLINLSYELLILSFSQRKTLLMMLKKLQIIDDHAAIQSYQCIKELYLSIAVCAETTEKWLGNDEDPEAMHETKKWLEVLDNLDNLLKASKEGVNKSVLEEPDGETIPRNEQLVSNGEDFKNLYENRLFEKNERPNVLNQNLFRNENIYMKIIEILVYDIESFTQEREALKSTEINELHKEFLKKCYHILARFVCDNSENQAVLKEFLMPIFLKHIKTVPDVNAGLLIEHLFKDNKSLLSNTSLFQNIIHTIVEKVDVLEDKNGIKANYLECLKIMTRYKDRLYKNNQTYLITELCSNKFTNVFLTYSKNIKDLQEMINDFQQNLEKSRKNIDLPPQICYLCSLLKILSITCEGENNATESKCQTFVNMKQIIKLLSISNECWYLRKYILAFYFHVYLETERELNEDKKDIDDLNRFILKDLDFLTENMAANNSQTIRTNRGVFNLKHIKQKYIIALLPCIKQILFKKIIKDETKRQDFIKIILTNIMKLSHWLDDLSTKNKAKVSSFVSFLIESNLATEEFKTKIDREFIISKGGFKKTVISNLSMSALNMNSSNQPGLTVISPTNMLENVKENKLFSQIEALEHNEHCIQHEENEFEQLVKYIVNITDKSEKVFEGECTIQLEEISTALINLISNTESSLSKDLTKTSLTIFRKIIEMENPEKTNPAAEWKNEDYHEKHNSIIRRQNQLVVLGVVKMLISIISNTKSHREVKEEALLVSIALLLGGNRNAQDAFIKEMTEDRNNNFCQALKSLLQSSFDAIKKAMSLTNKKIIETVTELSRLNQADSYDIKKLIDDKPLMIENPETTVIKQQITSTDLQKDENKNPIIDIQLYDEDKKELIFLRRTFRLLQLFCEGHHRSLQNFLREQMFHGIKSGLSFDFVHLSGQFFGSYIKFVNKFCLDFGNQLLDFMIEAIQGPSLENQLSFCKNKSIDVCKDFMAKFNKKLDFERAGFFSDKEEEDVNNVVTKSSKLLFSLIEGAANEEILNMLSEGLDFNFLLQHLKEEFCDLIERVGVELADGPPKKGSKVADLNNILDVLREGGPVTLAELNLEDFNEKLPDHFDEDFLEAFNIYTLIVTLSDPAVNKSNGQNIRDLLQNVTDAGILKTLEFFQMHCCSIEISFNGTIIRVYFPVHPICSFLSKNSRTKFGNDVNRDTPNDKIKDLVNNRNDFFDEMIHLAYLQKQLIVFSSKRLNMLRDLSTILAFIINFWILYSYSIVLDNSEFAKGRVDASDPVLPIDAIINYFGYAQLVTSCLMLIFWTFIYGPLILKNNWRDLIRSYGMELQEQDRAELDDFINSEMDIGEANTTLATRLLFYKGPDDPIFVKKYKVINRNGEEIEKNYKDFGNFFTKMQYWWISTRILFTAGSFLYMLFYILISWMGVFISEIAYCLHLFDVINRFQTLTNVIKSVTYNAKQLILTLLFGLTLLYIYAMIGFYFFNDTYYNSNNSTNECATLFQCYISTINFGLRNGGGMGDYLAPMNYSKENSTYYAIRFFYDLTFFAFVNIVFLNIIFGIIVDTFAELREKKNKMDEDRKTVCFICGVDRYTFDRFSDGFENHIERDHQMWNYIYYMYLLSTKDSTDFNGVETYVSEKLAHDDNSWFPLLTALALGEEKKEDVEGLITEQMKSLETELDLLKTKVELIGKK